MATIIRLKHSRRPRNPQPDGHVPAYGPLPVESAIRLLLTDDGCDDKKELLFTAFGRLSHTVLEQLERVALDAVIHLKSERCLDDFVEPFSFRTCVDLESWLTRQRDHQPVVLHSDRKYYLRGECALAHVFLHNVR